LDPSQHSAALSPFLIPVAALAIADLLISWISARAAQGGPALSRLRNPAVRAGLRAGQAAGLLALFGYSGHYSHLAALPPAVVFLLLTVVISDNLLPRLVSRRRRGASTTETDAGPPEAESGVGLTVVASRAERLRDTPVSRLMVPRKSIVGCESSASVAEVASLMAETGLSRVIVFGKTLDRPLGLAHVKDLLPLMYEGKGSGTVERLLRPLVLVPAATRAIDLLRDFQRLKRRVAVVRDIQGEKTLGLVTTEDILEEMVGEIQDRGEALSAALDAGVALVRGDVKVGDLTEGLGISPAPDVGHLSLNELVKSLLGKEVSKGDVVIFGGLRIKVEETVNGDVWMVRIDRIGG
jgi:CBS domain containing-hemolysin-like protein